MTRAFPVLLALLALAACSGNQDSVMWDCQLAMQKGNAGRSADAVEERNRDIESCMRARGYRLDSKNPACRQAVTNSSCYQAM